MPETTNRRAVRQARRSPRCSRPPARGFGRSSARKPAARVAPITMVINQSPWFDGFRQLVEQYQKETGNKIELDVNPYAGALDKIRNSLRASAGSYDLLAIDNNWMVEMFDGGFLVPLPELDPAFRLDPQISTYGGTDLLERQAANVRSARRQADGRADQRQRRGLVLSQGPLRPEGAASVPETWDQVLDHAQKLNDGARVYGFVHRDDRDSALADFANYLFSFGGDIFADASAGDFTVVVNSPAARARARFLPAARQGRRVSVARAR